MSDWDSFVDCVEGRNAMVAQFLRNEGLNAFNGSQELALAGVRAVTDWWERLRPEIKWGIRYGSKRLTDTAWKRLAVVVAEAGGLIEVGFAAAEIVGYIALFLAVLVVSFEIGVLATASAECAVVNG